MHPALITLALVACGGSTPPPKPPAPRPAASLAKHLEDDMAMLAEIARRHAGDCVGLTAALRPHVDRMKGHHADVEAMLGDAEQSRELKTELAKYPAPPDRTDRTATDLGAAYRACADADAKYGLEKVIAEIPTY